MKRLRSWIVRLASLFNKDRRDRELAAEMEAHLQMHMEDNLRAGMSPDEARRITLIKLGGIEQTKEAYRDRKGVPVIENIIQDIRFAVRILLKTPAITAVALLSLALGIGANTAIFSLVDSVMLRSLPVQKPEELVQVLRALPRYKNGPVPSFTNPIWEQVRDHQDVFSGAFAWSNRQFDLADGGEAQHVSGMYASGDYFTTLGVRPLLGHVFTASDDRRGCAGVAVLSYGFWQEHYAGAENAMGSTLHLNGHSFEVMGVMPPSFFGMEVGEKFDVAVPLCAEAVIRGKDSFLDHHSAWWLKITGRLKPGMTREQATTRLAVLAPEIFSGAAPLDWDPKDRQAFRNYTLATRPAANGLTDYYERRTQYRRPLEILMAIVALVLLIACANIASLMLARSAARQKEIAVRLSLGASRARLIRQVLTESLVLSGAGALLGVLFAKWGGPLLLRLVSTSHEKVFLDLSMNIRILGFTAGAAICTGLLFGILPALRATRVSLTSAMKEGLAEAAAERSRLHFVRLHLAGFSSGRWIVAAQVALSLILLVGTALFARSFRKLVTLDAGFDRNNVLLISADIHNAQIPLASRPQLYNQILGRLKSVPGAASVSQSWFTPIQGAEWNTQIAVEGVNLPWTDENLVYFNGVRPGYLAAVRTPLLAGRDFTASDVSAAPRVALINETLARRFFPNANPVGKYFRMPSSPTASSPAIQIVGLMKNAKYESFREGDLNVAYIPLAQMDGLPEQTSFEIRTASNPVSLVPAVREAVGQVNKAASLEFGTLAQQLDDSLVQERLLATLSGFFGGLALLLTAVGLYGTMAYAVTRRQKEIGIRVALGAERRTILSLMMQEAVVVLSTGIAVGLLGAWWVTRLVEQLLFGMTGRDAISMIYAAVALACVAMLAGYLPARRAVRVDPMIVLRYE